MPSTHIPWRDVWVGAATTSLLFSIGKWAIGLYLGKSDIASGFGLFGSLALLMIWIYYSAQIFLFGAEFTWVYASKYGSRRNAARVPPVLKAQPAANEEVLSHVAKVNAAAPVVPPYAPVVPPYAPRRPAPRARASSMLHRHFPEIAIAGAFIAGMLLRAAAPRGFRILRRRLPH
jgi:hypothetical protein